MKKETIEKRIKSFEFWENTHFGLLMICFGLGYVIPYDSLQSKLESRIMFWFFLAMFFVCRYMGRMYTDMLEGKD